jgi:hypothetical protein
MVDAAPYYTNRSSRLARDLSSIRCYTSTKKDAGPSTGSGCRHDSFALFYEIIPCFYLAPSVEARKASAGGRIYAGAARCLYGRRLIAQEFQSKRRAMVGEEQKKMGTAADAPADRTPTQFL